MDKVYLVILRPSPAEYECGKSTSTERIIVCIASSYDAAVTYLESDSKYKRWYGDTWISEMGSTGKIIEKPMNRALPMSADAELAKMLI